MAAADDLSILADAQADCFDVVHARILRDFPKLVIELGGNPGALMAQAKVERSSGGGMTYRQLIALIELAATADAHRAIETESDAQGRFSMEHVLPGSYVLTITPRYSQMVVIEALELT